MFFRACLMGIGIAAVGVTVALQGGQSASAEPASMGAAAVQPPVRIIVEDSMGAVSLNEDFACRLDATDRATVEMLLDKLNKGLPTPAFCFSGPVSADKVAALEAIWNYNPGEKFFGIDGDAWTATATDGSGFSLGTPITITYSFVPDGTNLGPAQISGESTGTSDLFADMNAAFGSASAWQDLVREVFAHWQANSSLTYVEVSDDGAAFPNSGGVLGSRGDVRIAGRSIDGSSGPNTLAYNFFPQSGDMVLDTDNASDFAGSTANNFKLFRNTVSHEHGHGMGFQHVCPNDEVIIMEPFVPVSTSAPDMLSEDDIAHIHRKYGDVNEVGGGNDDSGTATDLGTPPDGLDTVADASIDSVDDTDVYEFTITEPKEVTITLRPVGSTYTIADQDNGPADCSGALPSASFNLASRVNLGVRILDSDGSTVLVTQNSEAAGVNEVLSGFNLSAAGTYYIEVFTNDADTSGTVTNQDAQVQLYELDYTIGAGLPPEPIPTVPSGAPAAGLLGLLGLSAAVGVAGAVTLRRRR